MSETHTEVVTAPVLPDLDSDLLRQMQEEGLLTEDDIASMGAAPIETLPVVNIENAEPELLENLTDEIEHTEYRQEIYASQEDDGASLIEDVAEEVIAPAVTVMDGTLVVPGKRTRPKRGKRGTISARSVRPKGLSDGAYAATLAGEMISLVGGMEIDTAALVDGVHAIKIREKAVNFLNHFHKQAPLSIYTKIALRYLHDHGELSAKSLAAVYMTDGKRGGGGFSPGTAASQSQQMVTLFKTFGLMDMAGKLIPESTYYQLYANNP